MADTVAEPVAQEVVEPPVVERHIPVWESLEITGVEPVKAVQAEEVKPDAVTPPVVEKLIAPPEDKSMSPKARENFKRQQEEYAQRETKLKADLETRDAELKEAREKLSQVPTLDPSEIQRRDDEIQKLRGELRHVALERDPEFVARFETPKQQLSSSLREMASTVVPAEEFDRAFKLGLTDKQDEIRDSLTVAQQRRWDATLIQMEQVDIQRGLALQNRDTTYNEILQQRQQANSASLNERFQHNLQLARAVAAEGFEKVAAFKDDLELKQEITSMLTAVAGGEGADEWTPEKLMRQIAASKFQEKVLLNQHAVIQGKDAEIAELTKKNEELTAFVEAKHGGLPRTDVSKGGEKMDEPYRPSWETFGETNGSSNGGRKIPAGFI